MRIIPLQPLLTTSIMLQLLAGLLLVTIVSASPTDLFYNVEHVAGNGLASFSGDGGDAKLASMNQPRGVAVTSSGVIYFVDNNNHRIRKITPSGVISTVAGNGQAGFSGDGGLASSAQLNNPGGLFYHEKTGDLYVADADNNRIRKISSNGVIQTVAGTGTKSYNGEGISALSAHLNFPWSVVVTPEGVMYIGDAANHRIRKVTNGIIQLVAGNGVGSYSGDGGNPTSASLNNPYSVFVATNGDVYIADSHNQRVRKVSNNIISSVCGNGEATNNGDGGLATSASCGHPNSVLVSPAGDIFISSLYGVIRKISTNGIISTIAGTGNIGYTGEGGLATNSQIGSAFGMTLTNQGVIYFTDSDAARVRRLTPQCVANYVPTSSYSSCEPLFCHGQHYSTACGGSLRGSCIAPNVCQCTSNYGGLNCELVKCNGILQNITSLVCNGRGTCVDVNVCNCNANYGGQYCDVPKCNGILQGSSNVCSGHGSCDGFDTCRCDVNWGGKFCNLFMCNGILQNATALVCNGRGVCTSVDKCNCNSGFGGQFCDQSIPVIVNNKIIISYGQTITITTQELLATDAIANDSQIQFTISNLQNGRFELHTPSITVVNTFSQLQVKEGKVKFVHTGTKEQSPSFQINISNGISQASVSSSPAVVFNRPPYVKNKMLDQFVETEKQFSIAVSKDIFADPDGETLSYKASLETGQPLPSWIKFDEQNYILTGKSLEPSTNKFKFHVVDKGNMEAESVFEFKVIPRSGLGVVELVAIIVPIAGLVVSIIALIAGGGGIWGCIKYFKRPKPSTTGATSPTAFQSTTHLSLTPSTGTSTPSQSSQSTSGAPKP